MKTFKNILIVLFALPMFVFAQETKQNDKEQTKEKPARAAFEGSTLIENATNVLFQKNTLEIQMSHRFGLLNGGTNDMAGFWAPSNIRIGLAYAITDYITVGYGTTKFSRLQDFNLKVGLLRQTRSNSMPISVTYFGNATVDARTKDNFNLKQDRYSYFSQLIIAKRFSSKFSAQVAPSISHFNLVEPTIKNDMIAIAFGGRYKISPNTAIIVDYSQPITSFYSGNPNPGIAFGVEFATSGHAFQLFATNYNGLSPQKNYMYNHNDFINNGDFMIGFNITRKYNF
ncbi:MAG: DUF5777 family beta-barrel protein [Lutibacter sp.]|uniref:DUF5777 family beta-barrel protein n=1 Tax=Lutibacter sp. TaxID=1925666 RepID=UPI0038598380